MRATLESHGYTSVTGTARLKLLPQKCLPKSCQRLKSMTSSSHLFLSRIDFLIFLHTSLLYRSLIIFDALLDLFIPISLYIVTKPKNICLHMCSMNSIKSMHLHINGQILLTSQTRPLHRHCFSRISCHDQNSAGSAWAKITGTRLNHSKALTRIQGAALMQSVQDSLGSRR